MNKINTHIHFAENTLLLLFIIIDLLCVKDGSRRSKYLERIMLHNLLLKISIFSCVVPVNFSVYCVKQSLLE